VIQLGDEGCLWIIADSWMERPHAEGGEDAALAHLNQIVTQFKPAQAALAKHPVSKATPREAGHRVYGSSL
jgi:hypothetical protein